MRFNLRHLAALAALGLIASPVAAQNTVDRTVTTVPVQEEHHDFPWGLLGLLGLGGLLGRKREHDHDHRPGTNNTTQ